MEQRLRIAQSGTVPRFENCSRRELARLAANTRVETVGAGHRLLSQGSPSPNLYVMIAGTAGVTQDGEQIAQLAMNAPTPDRTWAEP